MSSNSKVLENAVAYALSIEGAHVETRSTFERLDWRVAGTRPEGVPHSIYQLLNHMIYWQEWVVKWLDGEKPAIPKHASGSRPGSAGPASPEEWERAAGVFGNGLDELDRRSRDADLFSKLGKKSRLEMLHTIASHNSYHLGQVVLLRQILGAWPPPSGGLTW